LGFSPQRASLNGKDAMFRIRGLFDAGRVERALKARALSVPSEIEVRQMYTSPKIIATIDGVDALTGAWGQEHSVCTPTVCG
jgi:hypothetical protein